ncbi:hypothetical protein DFH28DRAFT_173468 [Melampsora americana]|nr:hypothetical protein DFH28DRAFT_173468 [Melampsora americana]
MKESCYKILGVPRHADESDITSTFLIHGIGINSDGSSEENPEHQKVVEAYNTLKDPTKRREHDQSLEASGLPPRPSSPPPATPRLQYQSFRVGGSNMVQSPAPGFYEDFTPTLAPHQSGIKERRLYLFGDSERGSNPTFATIDSKIPFPSTIKKKEAKDDLGSYVKVPNPDPKNQTENGSGSKIESSRRAKKLQKKR